MNDQANLLSVKTRWACGDADRQSEDEGEDCGREDDQQADDRPPTKSPLKSTNWKSSLDHDKF